MSNYEQVLTSSDLEELLFTGDDADVSISGVVRVRENGQVSTRDYGTFMFPHWSTLPLETIAAVEKLARQKDAATTMAALPGVLDLIFARYPERREHFRQQDGRIQVVVLYRYFEKLGQEQRNKEANAVLQQQQTFIPQQPQVASNAPQSAFGATQWTAPYQGN